MKFVTLPHEEKFNIHHCPVEDSLATIDKVTILSENTLFFIQMFHIKYILSFEATVLFLWEYNLYYIE